MSILVVELLPDGIIFGADRNITVTESCPEFHDDVKEVYITTTHGQSQRPKVLKWPNKKALVGYVGEAEIGGMPTDEWLYDFMGNNLEFASFKVLANNLTDKVQTQLCTDLDTSRKEPGYLVIHLAGFEERESEIVPVVWTITNATGLEDGKYTNIKKEFHCADSFGEIFVGSSPKVIRENIIERAQKNDPWWFHQGTDLPTFNAFEAFLRLAFSFLSQVQPRHSTPQTLQEWQQFIKMIILTYGAYYQAFKKPEEQFVGGGADTVCLEWP